MKTKKIYLLYVFLIFFESFFLISNIITGVKIIAVLIVNIFFIGQIFFVRKKTEISNDNRVQNASELAIKTNKNAMKNLPLGIIAYNDKGTEIEWINPFAKQTLFSSNNFSENIKKKIDGINKNTKKFDLAIGNEIFSFFSISEMEHTVFFENVTEDRFLRQKQKKNQLVMGIVSIDNYDEATDSMSDKDISYLNSNIETMLSDWMTENNIYYKRINSERYYYYLYFDDLNKIMNEKFKLLDSVRVGMNQQNIPITISMGISYGSKSITEIAMIAQTNLDIALARGGDQVVIREAYEGATPIYYGGNTTSPERRTRVRSRAMSTAIKKIIQNSTDVYIMGHLYPDMDAIGSAFGMAKLTELYGIRSWVVLDKSKINQDVKRCIEELDNYPEILNKIISPDDASKKVGKSSLLIMVDYHKPSMSISTDLYKKFIDIVIIDHHRRGSEFPDKPLLTYIESSASSASELISELIEYETSKDKKIIDFEATMLLAGIMVDTKNFTIRTTSRTFDSASYLRSWGADTVKVQYLLREDLQGYLQKSHLISLSEYVGNNIVVAMGEDKKEYDSVTTAKTADTLLVIAGIKASFVITRRSSTVVGISARSFGEINVQKIMETMGGGGHFTNAAVQFNNISTTEVKNLLLVAIDSYTKES